MRREQAPALRRCAGRFDSPVQGELAWNTPEGLFLCSVTIPPAATPPPLFAGGRHVCASLRLPQRGRLRCGGSETAPCGGVRLLYNPAGIMAPRNASVPLYPCLPLWGRGTASAVDEGLMAVGTTLCDALLSSIPHPSATPTPSPPGKAKMRRATDGRPYGERGVCANR